MRFPAWSRLRSQWQPLPLSIRCQLPNIAVERCRYFHKTPSTREYPGGPNQNAVSSASSRLRDGSVHNIVPAAFLTVADEVRHALSTNQPVVALESTIYTHGLPYPENIGLALKLEQIVRANGAIPATIGIVDGTSRVGLSVSELARICEAAGNPDTIKVSRRDLPYILGMVGVNATSVD